MSSSPSAPSLGASIEHRRLQLHLSRAKAARTAGVARSTWIGWEDDRMVPGASSRALIEKVLDWEQGSVTAILEGRAPTPLREALATVTPIRAEVQVPADEAELAAEWRAMDLPEPFVAELLEAYRAGKAELRERFRYRARETGT